MAKQKKPKLRIRKANCNGCMSCQINCATLKEGICAPVRARIHVQLDPWRARHRITVCRQCKEAKCAEACPEDAITLSDDGTYWAIDYDLCKGCRECVEACSFDAIFYDPQGDRVIKCDTCQGDPLCAQVCALEAIIWDG